MSYLRKCKNPNCGKEFWGTRTQQYCCSECRPTMRKSKIKSNCTISEVARKANADGISYGKYVAMKYLEERKKNNE